MRTFPIDRGGSLIRATEALAGPLPRTGVTASDPARMLARLLDLRGSVDLARALGAKARPGWITDDRDLETQIARAIDGELAAIRSHARRGFARLARALGAGDVLAALGGARIGAGRTPRAVSAASQALASRLTDETGHELFGVVGQARLLRREVGPDIACLGNEAARLERLDALLGKAIERGVDARLGAILPSVRPELERRFEEAIVGLSGSATTDEIAAWLAPSGVVAESLALLESIVLAALAFEGDRITSLLRAAAGAERARSASPVGDEAAAERSAP